MAANSSNDQINAFKAALEQAFNAITDDTGRLTVAGSIKLGRGVQGLMITVKGRKTLVNLCNMSIEPMEISEGQRKWAKEHPRKDGTFPVPVPYLCKGNAQLDDGHYVNVTIKKSNAKGQGDWE